MKSLTVVVLLSTLAVCCMVSSVDGLKCYECGGSKKDHPCSTLSGDYGTEIKGCGSCAWTNQDHELTRGCGENKDPTSESCRVQNEVPTFCECRTDLCNTEFEVMQKNLKPGSIKCYDCEGVECHKEEGSTKDGCASCLKGAINGNIMRLCSPKKADKNACETKQGATGCACDTDFCNAAAEFASSRLLIGCVLAAMLVVCRLF